MEKLDEHGPGQNDVLPINIVNKHGNVPIFHKPGDVPIFRTGDVPILLNMVMFQLFQFATLHNQRVDPRQFHKTKVNKY